MKNAVDEKDLILDFVSFFEPFYLASRIYDPLLTGKKRVAFTTYLNFYLWLCRPDRKYIPA